MLSTWKHAVCGTEVCPFRRIGGWKRSRRTYIRNTYKAETTIGDLIAYNILRVLIPLGVGHLVYTLFTLDFTFSLLYDRRAKAVPII